ncbi:MAG: holo-ACP synthase [Alphaproteobacteria bacterium]|nr:holo-ACP synthase [Alphaproteobacteria bacterium]
MIIGIGIDILDIRRIRYLLNKFGKHFENKYFTHNEIQLCYSKDDIEYSFAKLFSMKESIIKAISNKSGMTWHTTEISHDVLGKPIARVFCNLYGTIPNEKYSIHVSTSDEKEYVVSIAILEIK